MIKKSLMMLGMAACMSGAAVAQTYDIDMTMSPYYTDGPPPGLQGSATVLWTIDGQFTYQNGVYSNVDIVLTGGGDDTTFISGTGNANNAVFTNFLTPPPICGVFCSDSLDLTITPTFLGQPVITGASFIMDAFQGGYCTPPPINGTVVDSGDSQTDVACKGSLMEVPHAEAPEIDLGFAGGALTLLLGGLLVARSGASSEP